MSGKLKVSNNMQVVEHISDREMFDTEEWAKIVHFGSKAIYLQQTDDVFYFKCCLSTYIQY